MPLQNLRFTMTYPGGVNLEQKIREFEGGIGISPGNGMPIKYNRSSEVYGQLIAFVFDRHSVSRRYSDAPFEFRI